MWYSKISYKKKLIFYKYLIHVTNDHCVSNDRLPFEHYMRGVKWLSVVMWSCQVTVVVT